VFLVLYCDVKYDHMCTTTNNSTGDWKNKFKCPLYVGEAATAVSSFHSAVLYPTNVLCNWML